MIDKLFRSLILILTVVVSTLIVGAQSDLTTKLIISNTSVVEIAPDNVDQSSNALTKVNVKVNGKLAKSFMTEDFIFPQIIGSYHGITWNIGENSDVEYIFFRTSMGNGSCAGGTLYVLAFLEDELSREYKNVRVSQPLTTCLGEFPSFAVSYTKAGAVLDIAGHTLNLDKLDRWVEKKIIKRKIKAK